MPNHAIGRERAAWIAAVAVLATSLAWLTAVNLAWLAHAWLADSPRHHALARAILRAAAAGLGHGPVLVAVIASLVAAALLVALLRRGAPLEGRVRHA